MCVFVESDASHTGRMSTDYFRAVYHADFSNHLEAQTVWLSPDEVVRTSTLMDCKDYYPDYLKQLYGEILKDLLSLD